MPTDHPQAPPSPLTERIDEMPKRVESDIERWTRELKAAGWVEVRMFTWMRPDGALFRGPAGAWHALEDGPVVTPKPEVCARVLAMFNRKRATNV